MGTFRNLPEKQAEVFELVAINQDGGHPLRTLQALVKKGLIEEYRESHPGITIIRYRVPLPIHYEWCLWCAENVTDEEMEGEGSWMSRT